MTRATAGWLGVMTTVIAIAALACSLARAEDGAVSGPPDERVTGSEPLLATVTASVVHGPNGFDVEGRIRVTATPATAWAVLTDYDGIDRFVSSMRASRVTSRGDDYVLVEQEAVGRLLLFKRRMRTTLRVHEQPPGRIEFEDVLKKDFEHYRGEWRIEERGDDVEIDYRVSARPAVSVPDFVARSMFQRTVRQLLSELEKEITSRTLSERQP